MKSIFKRVIGILMVLFLITGMMPSVSMVYADDDITRGQVVMFLWRAAGQPEPKNNTQKFKDVPFSASVWNAA